MRYTVTQRRAHTRDVVTLTLRAISPMPPPLFRPGQFAVLGGPGKTPVASLLSGQPDPGAVQFTVRADTPDGLAEVVCGTPVTVTGPLGAGWPLPAAAGADVVLVAGGLGLAPLRPLLHQLTADRARYRTVSLFIGGRRADDLLFADEHRRWMDRGVGVDVIVDPQPTGVAGWIPGVAALFGRLPPPAGPRVAYVCGPELLLRPVARGLVAHGVPPRCIWLASTRPPQRGLDPIVRVDHLREPAGPLVRAA